MSIISKYLSREIVKQFSMVLITVICIYLVVDFFEKSDNFVRVGLPFSRTLSFFMLNIPFIVWRIAPVGILLSVIIVFSLMNKNNEILALQSSGVSLQSLLTPIAVFGVVGSLLLFFFAEAVVPVTTLKANQIWTKEVKKQSLVTSREKNIWIRGDRKIVHIKYYQPKEKAVFGITINFFDEKFRLVRKIDAGKGLFVNGRWVLYDVLEQKLNPAMDVLESAFHPELAVNLEFLPEDLKQVVKKPSEMSFSELLNYIRKVESEGYDATQYRVDLQAKPAYAFTCVIMCLLGMGISVKQHRQQNIFFSITYGIVAAFFYWILYSFCLSLGYGDMLPPVMAAWAANIVFSCLGILILVSAE